MTTYAEAKQVLPVEMDVDHGVLVATIHAKSLLYEIAINEIEDCIVASISQAKSALLVDCGELTLHVSSQFLSMLVRVHREANQSGLKMGICNLSESLQLVYNVTALQSVLPAYDTRHHAIAALGEFDIWEQRPIHELDSEVEKSRPRARRFASIRSLAIVAGLLLGVAGAVLIGSLLMTMDNDSAALDQPAFRSAVNGHVAYVDDGTQRPDTASMIVVWPAKTAPSAPLTSKQFRQAQTEGWIDIQHGISVGRVNSSGDFALPTLSQADHTNYHVLVISGHVQRHERIPTHDQLLLSQSLADPHTVLGDREFTMGRIQVGPRGRSRFDWTFAPRQQ